MFGKMDLTNKLYKALKSEHSGFAMIEILEEAKSSGVKRKEAEEALYRLLDRLPPERPTTGITNEHDLVTEMLMITQNFCQPKYRIWTDE